METLHAFAVLVALVLTVVMIGFVLWDYALDAREAFVDGIAAGLKGESHDPEHDYFLVVWAYRIGHRIGNERRREMNCV